MGASPRGARTRSTPRLPGGGVTGSILRAGRESIGRTQDQFGEALRVDANTVKAWETGRRPLINAPFVRLQNLRRALQREGVQTDLLHHWERALQVDAILVGLSQPEPDVHPLALMVPDRLTTQLLAWPLTGDPPSSLQDAGATLNVARGERDSLAADLRRVVEHKITDDRKAAMLRRQAKFLLANHGPSREWVGQLDRQDHRDDGVLRSGQWTPRWPVARSSAVSAAHSGDLEPLERFIAEGLCSDTLINANLNYWAYWVGEYRTVWHADEAMNEADTEAWSGEYLLESLLAGICHAPYRDLCAHTLWALLRTRRTLASHPTRRSRIRTSVQRALEAGALAKHARERLEQVHYLTGSD